MSKLKVKSTNSDVAAARRKEYPDIGDQLDAIWKAIKELKGNKKLSSDIEDALAKVKAVKAKYRKKN